MSWLKIVSLSLLEPNWNLQTAVHVLMSFTDQIIAPFVKIKALISAN